MKKTTKKLFVASLFFLCLGCLTFRSHSSSSDVDIKQNGIKVQMVSSTQNSYGEKDQTFSYVITPTNATNQEINVSVTYIDKSNCDAVMSFSHLADEKKITLSCKAPFSKQIQVVLTSKANSNATATMTLDYVKKLKNITPKFSMNKGTSIGNGWDEIDNKISDFSISNFMTPNYTIFTKDKNYSFKMKISSLFIADDFTIGAPEAAKSAFTSQIKKKMEDGSAYFTDEELWNLDSSNAWHSILKSIEKDDLYNDRNFFDIQIDAVFSCNEVPSISVSNTFYLECSLLGNYDSKTVGVDKVTIELPNLEF